jgi:pilus assembly protein FimV
LEDTPELISEIDIDTAADDSANEVETDSDFSADFDLDELDDLPDFTAETAEADVATGADQEIDLDQLAASENEFDFLAGTDECATKLDLARAYLDMEDLDGAKELLQEVVTEGSDQQKTDARTLMESIG